MVFEFVTDGLSDLSWYELVCVYKTSSTEHAKHTPLSY